MYLNPFYSQDREQMTYERNVMTFNKYWVLSSIFKVPFIVTNYLFSNIQDLLQDSQN